MEQADSLWLLPQLRTAVPAATAKPITWMPSAWFGTGLAIAVWGTREDGSSAEEEPVRLHQKTASGPAFHPAQNPVKQQKLLLVLKSVISNHKYKRSTQAGICSNALSKYCAARPAVSDCDSVTQVVSCFMAGKASSYSCWHFKDMQSVKLNSHLWLSLIIHIPYRPKRKI